MAIEPIPPRTYTWPTDGAYLANLHVSLDELAARFRLEIYSFVEDGAGPARSVGLRTSSGMDVQITEWGLWPPNRPKGLEVDVDASVLGNFGAEALLTELISEMGVSRSDFSEVADAARTVAAAEWAVQIANAKHRPKLPRECDGEISFDLVMEDEMAFVEGTYRLRNGDWRVFIFSRHEGDQLLSSEQVWNSGVEGWVIRTPQGMKLNRGVVKQVLGDLLYVEQWVEVRGPDSTRLR